MSFLQTPPQLGNQYECDATLQEFVAHNLEPDVIEQVEETYRELGELGGGELYHASIADRKNEPIHTPWDAWGRRIDHIEVSPLWHRAKKLAATYGLVAAGYEKRFGAVDRVHQFIQNYLIQASLDVYSCPLAMTDGAAQTLLQSNNQPLIERAMPHLTSRDPETLWTSGQWMTERIGGSDVSLSETVAEKDGDLWRLTGTKWFTSASTSNMALTLARPKGNGPGSKGLALFYIELRDEHGNMNNLEINRLKDKLGTRKVPTAELSLRQTLAHLVKEPRNGVKDITPMLNVTRTWNAMAATWSMRRAQALVVDYAGKRHAFGHTLAQKPLHQETMADIIAECDAAFHLAFRLARLLGQSECGELSPAQELLFRVLTPLTKLLTAKQAVSVISESLECFGGAGYIEDTGLPRMYADAQVLPIWEGTTNVLSLDALRALAATGAFDALIADTQLLLAAAKHRELAPLATMARKTMSAAGEWLASAVREQPRLESGARRLALTLGRSYQLALLCNHAGRVATTGEGRRAIAAAQRFAALGINHLRENTPPLATTNAALLAGWGNDKRQRS